MGTGRTRSKPERRHDRREEERHAEDRQEAAPHSAALHVTPAERIQALAGDPSFMTSLARGLTVIEAFSGSHHRPTTSLLSAQTGLPRAAVHRCLYTLRRLGFVDSDDERHYYLRPSVLSLGYSYLHSTPLASATQPVLERVSRLLHESCWQAFPQRSVALTLRDSPWSATPTGRLPQKRSCCVCSAWWSVRGMPS